MALLNLRVPGESDLDTEHLLEVFGQQRRRFVEVLRRFGPDDWAAPTRCGEWSAHDVVRHMCDITAYIPSAGDHTFDLAAGFDPRITPREWLSVSADEEPADTLARLSTRTEEMLALTQGWLRAGTRFDVWLPFGPVDWRVLMLHLFWDSWIHERDVLLARAAEHPTSDEATGYATAYGVFIAAAVAAMFGERVRHQLELSGAGAGIYDLNSEDGVALSVTRVSTSGPPAAQVADALAGRGMAAAVLGALPADTRTTLTRMGEFFNAPV
ncbi:MAG: hypothetical protein JWM19_3465 [Actinomycetia bacterium]|nr:hypothetical protein [Actinomycetes bacterium]